MRRGEVYDARLDPVEGSEQSGTRPVVIVSRDAIHASSPIVIVAPCSTYRQGRRIYPSQILVHPPDGRLDAGSIVLGEQVRVLDKRRLLRLRGALSTATMERLDSALRIALDL